MSSPHDLPPNPREAKRRAVPMHWSFYPVTVAMIAISIVVAAVTVNDKAASRVGFLYFWEETTDKVQLEAGVEERERIYLERYSHLPVREAGSAVWDDYEQRHAFDRILAGEVWRLFTPMFIHANIRENILHILFNMLWLWDFGRVLESRFRGLRFLLLVLAVSLAADVAQALVTGPRFGGMSGVNYGLFGFILLRQKFHPAGDVRLNPQTTPFMLIWLVVCFTGAVGPVANAAHVAGLVAGCAIGWVNAMMGGGWEIRQRRRRFQAALSQGDNVLHRCAVCRRTEKDDENLDFRIGSDGEEYCTEHLPKPGAQ